MPYIIGTCRQTYGAIDGTYNEWLMDNNDTAATVDTTGYITNARAMRMTVGDLVRYRQWQNAPVVSGGNRVNLSALGTITAVSTHIVLAINANGSANLSDATALVVTNTD